MPRAAVTGGAGFLGSHLSERLLDEGWDVLVLDSLLSGRLENLTGCEGRSGFEFQHVDVTDPFQIEGAVDWILHFASPASPTDYLEHPIHTLKVGAIGTLHALRLAKARGAGFVLASTSEVYGDPQVRPQSESYWGHVNPVGPRGVYDEAKRYAEAMTMAYHRVHGVPVRIARIFNTYGERMRPNDGRAVPTFIRQALAGDPMTIHGDGTQTRSLCYVDDLIDGLWRLLHWQGSGPVNLGNPEELSVLELAERIRSIAGSRSPIEHIELPEDDPRVRCPDIALARSVLGWEPEVSLDEGLKRTIAWARSGWSEGTTP